MYRVKVFIWVKGSVCFVLKFALPPFSPPLPSGVQITNKTCTEPCTYNMVCQNSPCPPFMVNFHTGGPHCTGVQMSPCHESRQFRQTSTPYLGEWLSLPPKNENSRNGHYGKRQWRLWNEEEEEEEGTGGGTTTYLDRQVTTHPKKSKYQSLY